MTKTILKTAITAVISLGVAHTAVAADMDANNSMGSAIPGMEKCYGMVKAGQNDCGTASHNCSGEAKVDGSKTDWVYLPKGLCDRIVGGNKVGEKSST